MLEINTVNKKFSDGWPAREYLLLFLLCPGAYLIYLLYPISCQVERAESQKNGISEGY